MTKELVITALEDNFRNSNKEPKGIVHPYRGRQYHSED